MIMRAGLAEAFQQTMYDFFDEAQEYDQLQAMYPQLFDVQSVDTAYVKKESYLGMGQLNERKEGDDIDNEDPAMGWSPVHKIRTFSKSFELTKEKVEDMPESKIGDILRDLAAGWSQGLTNSKEVFAAKFFNKGGLTAGHDVFNGTITGIIDDPSGDLIYDGKPFFNLSGNDRTAKNGSTYYNGTNNAFSKTNLQTAYNLMTNTNNYDEKGEKIALKPTHILYPSNLRFSIEEVLQNTDTANLKSNVQNLVQPMEWQYLDNATAWFLGVPKKGLKWYERSAPVIEVYQNPKNKNFYVTIDTRFGAGVDNWRYWQGNKFSTS